MNNKTNKKNPKASQKLEIIVKTPQVSTRKGKQNPPKRNQNQQNKKNRNGGRRNAVNNALVHTMKNPNPRVGDPYRYALRDATCIAAAGAKIPGEFSFPSTTERVKGRVTLNTDADGNASYIWVGHPTLTSWVSDVTLVTGQPYTGYTANPNMTYATTPDTLNSKFGTFRTVANGIKIKNLQAQLSATGSITVARVPMGIFNFGPNALTNSIVTADEMARLCGINLSSGQIPPSIIELPDSLELTVSELYAKEVIISNVPTSASAFTWRETSNDSRVTATQSEYDHVFVDNATGVPAANTADREAYCNMAGWTCILIRAEGMTKSTPVLDIMTASHIEGTPQIFTSAGAAGYVPDNIRTAGKGDAPGIVASTIEGGFAVIREVGSVLADPQNQALLRAGANLAGRAGQGAYLAMGN